MDAEPDRIGAELPIVSIVRSADIGDGRDTGAEPAAQVVGLEVPVPGFK